MKKYSWIKKAPLMRLVFRAHRITQRFFGNSFSLCSIMNVKSGKCTEDCSFCSQSARYGTDIETYPLISEDEIVRRAEKAIECGSSHIGIVASGRKPDDQEIESIARAAERISGELGLDVCCSLGALDVRQFKRLRQGGVNTYHHNIETSAEFYPRIVSSHPFSERVRTIELAKEAGFRVCSGGIIGMGESMNDRISMALLLKKLGVATVPLNILVPIPGTPLAGIKPLSLNEILRTIAAFRIILGNRVIKLAGGRESNLGDFQNLAFLAGANGMIIGGYLTLKGAGIDKDKELVMKIKEVLNN